MGEIRAGNSTLRGWIYWLYAVLCGWQLLMKIKIKTVFSPLNTIPKLESCGLCADPLPFSGRVREGGKTEYK